MLSHILLNASGIILAYLLGSIPTSVWISRYFFNIDVRQHGSKNAGATNAIRVMGPKVGIFVLLFDAFKGFLAVKLYTVFGVGMEGAYLVNYTLFLGICSVIGHIFPIFVGFRGGKGIATLLGVLIAIYPFMILYLIIIFFAVFLLTKYVSLASMLSAISFPVILVVFYLDRPHTILFVGFAIATALFVPITHKKNILRLIKGEEPKFQLKKTVK